MGNRGFQKDADGSLIVVDMPVVANALTTDENIIAFLSGNDDAFQNTPEFEERCMAISEYLQAEELRKASEASEASERKSRLMALRAGQAVRKPDVDILAAATRAGVTFDGEKIGNLVRLYEVVHKANGGENPRKVKSTDSATIAKVAVAVQQIMSDAGKPDARDLKSRRAAISSHFQHCHEAPTYGKTYSSLIW
jgi:hypothetical protein